MVRDAGAAPVAPDAAALAEAPAGNPGRDAGVPLDACDPIAQSGCPAAAPRCVVDDPPGPATCIVPPAEAAALGAPCASGGCLPGLACAVTTATAAGPVCVQLCDPARAGGCEALGDEVECRARIAGTRWGACAHLPPTCDPVTAGGCTADQACAPFLRQTGTWEFRCQPPGSRGEGQACSASDRCGRGLACVMVRAESTTSCRQICGTNTDCPGTDTCSGVVQYPYPQFHFCQP